MQCTNPYVRDAKGFIRALHTGDKTLDGVPFPCGQCLACRINKRRVWTARMMLELRHWDKASFVTLTYDNDHLPEGGSLVKRDLQLYFKRLRKAGCNFRYYAVGEYGDRRFRPHYHVAFFGLGAEDELLLDKYWGFGLIHVGSLTADSCQYIAGYIMKKLTKKDDVRLKQGQLPEFSLSSRRPAIGLIAIDDLVNALKTAPNFLKAMEVTQDVPISIGCEGKAYPLGRYMREKLFDRFDFFDCERTRERFFDESFKNYLQLKKGGTRDYKIELGRIGDRNYKRLSLYESRKKERDL